MLLSVGSVEKFEKPLRGEILSRDALALRAIELADFYTAFSDEGDKGVNLRARFKRNTKHLQNTYFQFSEAVRNKEVLTAGAEWLLDNYHIIDEQVREISNDLPRSYYRSLPKLIDKDWKGYPRVYRLICEFLIHTDSTIDIDTLSIFTQAFQSRSILKIGELWAVPIMLRLALVENLQRLGAESLTVGKHRIAADKLCEDVLRTTESRGSDILLNLVQRVGDDAQLLRDSGAFILRRLRAKGSSTSLALQWFDAKLRELNLDPDQLAREEQQSQASDQISFGNCVTSLKILSSIDWHEWFERVSHVDKVLLRDPDGFYERCDFATRDRYRQIIEKFAERAKKSQIEVAEALVSFASERHARNAATEDRNANERESHLGYFLIDDGYSQFEKALGLSPEIKQRFLNPLSRHALFVYLGTIGFLTLLLTAWGSIKAADYGANQMLVIFLALVAPIAVSEFVILAVQWVACKLTRPLAFPKLDFDKGIKSEHKTVVTIQSILSPHASIDELVEALEIRALGNLDKNISFGLLLDFQDSDSEIQSGDRGLVLQLQSRLDELNLAYDRETVGGFFALFRKRQWNASQGKFMGWERKRGKIEEFNHFLLGNDNTAFHLISGSAEELRKAKYVITLDSDTRLPPGSARKLIATMAHPLNRPVIDPITKIVTKGYGLLQPRMGIALDSALASRFSRIFSGQSGIDPYTQTISDVYQDLFKEGSYIGKGIYDIAAFDTALAGRVPENALLSHDLFEGCFARCGLVSDVELQDDFPPRYHQQARRQLRWIRGDWQLLPWMFRSHRRKDGSKEISVISALNRWKLFDNLRRSLVPVAALAALISCAFLPNPGSFFMAALLLWFTPFWLTVLNVAIDFVREFLQRVFEIGSKQSIFGLIAGAAKDIAQSLELSIYQFFCIPHQAVISLQAIFITLYRVFISKKNLLDWETAQAAQGRLGPDFKSFIKTFSNALIATSALIACSLVFGGSPLIIAGLGLIWLSAPVLMWRVSQTAEFNQEVLSNSDTRYLENVAFDTWCYFRTFLCPEYNYLIPDNLQLVPHRVVAERTSPTNISLACLSIVSSTDLGFAPATNSVDLLSNVFDSLAKLERFHGHFLNWYDIRTLNALAPRYVSTVDSGNMLGHFIAIKQALMQFLNTPLITSKHIDFINSHSGNQPIPEFSFLQGILDLTSRLRSSLFKTDSEAGRGSAKEEALKELCLELEQLVGWADEIEVIERLGKAGILHKKLQNIGRLLKGRPASILFLLKLTNRLLILDQQLSGYDLSSNDSSELQCFIAKLKISNQRLRDVVFKVEKIVDSIDKYIKEADFTFLLHPRKKLFVIGHNVDSGQRDNACYDLLASEARLASLVAISQHQVPLNHWFLLGRAITDSLGGKALLSWSATMFEYIMPLLVTRDYPGTLLNRTHRAVVKAQIAYGNLRGVPWGVSESAFSGVDFEKTYQYRAFGLPGLGYKRGLADDLVISPYSTALALMVMPQESCNNLRRLERDGVRGEFGFFEAADYTRERLGNDEDKHVIRSFLAHHQGMSLVAINNTINTDIIQSRFHTDPAIQSIELLLQERFPERTKSLVPHRAERATLGIETEEAQVERAERVTTPHTWYPQTQIISNGRYSVVTSNSGSGYSVFEGEYALTRWFSDAMGDGWGQFVYVRDVEDGRFWSTTYQPCRVEPSEYEVIYNPDKVETIRRDGGIRIRQELTVSPEDPVEVKRINITNLSRHLRKLELTSFAEVVLATDRSDKAHPAFSKLFIETEFIADYDALLLQRKPRIHGEKTLWMFHLVSMPIVWAPLQYETDRSKFIGRGLSFAEPAAMLSSKKLSGSTGTVLDPCISLRAQVEMEQGSSEVVTFVTGAARTKEEALHLIRKYHESYHISRAFEMAWSHADVEIRDQQFTLSRIRDYQRLASALILNVGRLRAPPDLVMKSTLSQAGLWRLGISGDEPVVLLIINDAEQLKIPEELLLAHEYLRRRGLKFDLVILNENAGGYLQNLRDELEFIVRSSYARQLMDQRGGVFLRAKSQLSTDEELLLHAVARVVIYGDKGSLSQQLKAAEMGVLAPLGRRSYSTAQSRKALGTELSARYPRSAKSPTGFGAFAEDGKSYKLSVQGDALTPLPWSNVVANENFGFLVTESGGGYTWSRNSRENRLTPWSNDPVLDPPGEVVYIRDLESGNFWSSTPAPASRECEVNVQHGFGFSSFELSKQKISSKLTLSVHPTEEAKFYHLELKNTDDVERKLEIYLYLEWVLGVNREATFRNIQTEYDSKAQILVARNPWNTDFSRQQVFAGSNLTIQSFTCSRREFIGRHGDLSAPGIFEQNSETAGATGQIFGGGLTGSFAGAKSLPVMLKGDTGAGFDSCGVIKVQIVVPPGSKQNVLFFLAQAELGSDLKGLSARYRSLSSYNGVFAESQSKWEKSLGAIRVKTPNKSFDTLINGWLLYQTLGCRMMARTGFYQSSGALGFRDQLQDSLALLWSEPERTRRQILLHASRQFKEGDVQHWWHPPMGRGIRTKISDNYIWMPYAVNRYLKVTGDLSILEEQIKYLDGPVLEPGQMENFFQPSISDLSESLYQHCLRALDKSLVVGPKGLPLIGCGDWNDGMNQVGEKGSGESVWLAWFLALTLRDFSKVVVDKGDSERAARYETHAKNLVAAIEKQSWDGQWYHRAYFDDGSALGASSREECRIDSLAQSWAVISGMGDPARAKQSMESVYDQLVDPKHKLIKLLTPPFVHSDPSPGYIQGYPPGIRENGGQYTHGACWSVWAAALLGDGAKAFELFEFINPINHTDTKEAVLEYQTEPYVTCGDVYAHPKHNGRGGWSWYTGSSGWLYQVAVEAILGLKVSGSTIEIDPCIPPDWKEFRMTYIKESSIEIDFEILNPKGVSKGVVSCLIDGQPFKVIDLTSEVLRGKTKISVLVTMG